jgi:hypothetical protein
MRPATAQAADGVLRIRGLVIEDASGRERILIGAPIPAAANRVRTDETRAREFWAGRYPDPDRYMGFYKGYNHETNGILIPTDTGSIVLHLAIRCRTRIQANASDRRLE